MKIFLITSPKPRLGKTSLLSGLSKVLIDKGKNVKIVSSIFSNSNNNVLNSEIFPENVVESGVLSKNGPIIDSSDFKKIRVLVDSFEDTSEYCFVESNLDSNESNNDLSKILNSESILIIDYSNKIKSQIKDYKENRS